MESMIDISNRYFTDKRTTPCEGINKPHNYIKIYEKYLSKFREKKFNLLEVGVGDHPNAIKNGSYRMWLEIFPQAHVTVIDYNESVLKNMVESERLTKVNLNQGRQDQLNSAAENFSNFDIIIDDGSHQVDHIIKTFNTFFPLLSDGGVYIIEDTYLFFKPEQNLNFFSDIIRGINYGISHKEVHKNSNSINITKDLAIITKGKDLTY